MSGVCRKWTVDNKGGVTCQPSPVPQLAPGHLLVQVHAICLLPAECSKSTHSFSGTVVSSFSNSAYKIGAKVWGISATPTTEEFTSIVMVPEWSVHKMKTNLSFTESSTLGGPGILACHALQVACLPASGKPRVLVHGGHTGISTFLIQAARVMKCQVECTTTTLEHRDACRNLGVSEFVDLIEGTPAGLTLAGFRGRRERNFHLVVDCLADDTTLYDYIEKYTHEGAKYITIKDRSVSWSGFFKRITTSVPRDYVYLSTASLLTAESAEKRLDLVNNILNHPEFVGIEIQDEYGIEDVVAARSAVESGIGFGCTVVEVVAPDSVEAEENLQRALTDGQVPVPALGGNGARSSVEAASATTTTMGTGSVSVDGISGAAAGKGRRASVGALGLGRLSLDTMRGKRGSVDGVSDNTADGNSGGDDKKATGKKQLFSLE